MTDVAYTVELPPTRRAPEHVRYAEELGYSHAFLFGMLRPTDNMKDWKRASLAILGTPLDAGEQVTDERVRLFHFVHTMQGACAVREMPGGPAGLEVIERVPEHERHLAIHQGHVQEMNEADRAARNAGGHVSLTATTWTAPAEEFGAAVRALAGSRPGLTSGANWRCSRTPSARDPGDDAALAYSAGVVSAGSSTTTGIVRSV